MSELSTLSSFSLTNLEEYYRFLTSGFLVDSANGRNLSNNNGVLNNPGRYDGGADFGSGNTNKSLTNTTGIGNISTNQKITLAGWFKPTSLASTTTFVSYGDNGNNFIYVIGYTSGAITFYKININTGGHHRGPTVTITPTGWFHVALTSDFNTVNGYLNGILIGSASSDSPGYSGGITPGIYIGADTMNNGWLSGLADDISLWSRILSTNEIKQLASNTGGFAGAML